MGRPREHNDETRERLLEVAERIVESEGLDALSVRRVAIRAGTTTRAVYSLFGSKDALVVALGNRAFEMLGAAIDDLPATADPGADLVEAAVTVFRRFVLDHPSLFALAVQRTTAPPELTSAFRRTAGDALGRLRSRVARVEAAGRLGARTVDRATVEFHALCEGLAAMELRGLLSADTAEEIWRDAVRALVAGFRQPASGL